jgi:hypothetical protein
MRLVLTLKRVVAGFRMAHLAEIIWLKSLNLKTAVKVDQNGAAG